MTADEREWVRRFRSGDPDDFSAAYDHFAPAIYRFCRRLCGHAADADDLTQETFVAAFQGIEGFEGRSSLVTWLYRIAYYRASRLQRSRKLETVPLEGEEASGAIAPDEPGQGIDRLDLQRALNLLPAPWRAALLLVKVEGLTCREAASVLGIPEGTVKYHIHEAVGRMKVLLGEDTTVVRRPRAALPAGGKESCDAV